MISKAEAYKKVEKILNILEYGDRYLIDKSVTDDYEWGWVIYYNTETFIKTKDVEYALMGNAPFLVIKDTGKVVATGTSEPVGFYIDEYFSTNDYVKASSTYKAHAK